MSVLSQADLALIRDEVGDADPSDVVLRRSYLEFGHWLPVAIRVLKRRRAAAGAGGGVSQVSIPGAIGVTLGRTDVASLDSQIAKLEAAWAAEQGLASGEVASSSRLCRVTPR